MASPEIPGAVLGVDVSRYQGVIEWRKVAAAGIRFAAIRATIGDTYKDPRFFANWEGAKTAGLVVTAYHVVRYDAEPQAQLDNLLGMIGETGGGANLPLVLDVELPAGGGASPQHYATLQNTIQMVKLLSQKRVMIYTGAWWWNPAAKDVDVSMLSNTDLWTASYTQEPILPTKPWSNWTFWQYSNKGHIAGIPADVDLNLYNGDFQSFQDWAKVILPDPDDVAFQTVTVTITGLDLNVEVNRL